MNPAITKLETSSLAIINLIIYDEDLGLKYLDTVTPERIQFLTDMLGDNKIISLLDGTYLKVYTTYMNNDLNMTKTIRLLKDPTYTFEEYSAMYPELTEKEVKEDLKLPKYGADAIKRTMRKVQKHLCLIYLNVYGFNDAFKSAFGIEESIEINLTQLEKELKDKNRRTAIYNKDVLAIRKYAHGLKEKGLENSEIYRKVFNRKSSYCKEMSNMMSSYDERLKVVLANIPNNSHGDMRRRMKWRECANHFIRMNRQPVDKINEEGGTLYHYNQMIDYINEWCGEDFIIKK